MALAPRDLQNRLGGVIATAAMHRAAPAGRAVCLANVAAVHRISTKQAVMAELLVELFSEEIPARMQGRAAEDLQRLFTEGLRVEGLAASSATAFATPRRLSLIVEGVPAQSPDLVEERKGPRVNAPEQAIAGFVKSAGLKSISDAQVVRDEKRGDFYVIRSEKPGRSASVIIAQVLTETVAKFPWPKSMRFNRYLKSGSLHTDGSASSAMQTDVELRWARPLRSILCLLDGTVVPLTIAGVASGKETRGHRFYGNQPFTVRSAADYAKALRSHKVILDMQERAALIGEQARALAREHKLVLVEDEALLAENAGLTEWPTVLIGSFDEAFLTVPAECLTSSMRLHQKCFSLKHPRSGRLANKFLLVSNLQAKDGGTQIIAGNERVIHARLADAKFFWEQDLKKPLDVMAVALGSITFHAKLGSQKERVERIAELAFRIAGSVDADKEDARRAAQLAKADLVSGMVGEFPELQGLMGRYYAQAAGTKPEIARAIELHYKPKGSADTVPTAADGDSVAIAVALADKLDALVGFWAIGEKPTGSGDPYQMRRAALGVIRIVLENDLRLPLSEAIEHAIKGYSAQGNEYVLTGVRAWSGGDAFTSSKLRDFMADRLKVQLREQGARYDLVDSVFALRGDDLAVMVKRVEALSEFLKTEDGATLLSGTRRAINILRDEERKDKTSYAGAVAATLLKEPQEHALYAAIRKVKRDTAAAINVENFAGAMRALAELRAPVDAFFDKVIVNAPDTKLRANRLALLSEVRAATLEVADFSKIAG
jgi:glycyl-tRNA synthetase beta chain